MEFLGLLPTIGSLTSPNTHYRGNMGARDYLHEDDYEFLFISQNGKCAICGTHQDTMERRLSVDHNHETGEVRGLLCSSCNLGLGAFLDSPALLKNAILYLVGGTGIYLSDTPITYQSESTQKSDWRTIQKDRDYILSAPIRELMVKYNISKATAYNWKSYIRLGSPSS